MSAATLGSLPLLERVATIRDRLLGSARFQRWAATFPLTRRVAAKHARSLFDICAGFVYSQVLSACVKLDLFRKLSHGPMTLAQLALHCQMTVEATDRLLAAAIAERVQAKACAPTH